MSDAFNAPWPPTPAMTTFTTLFGGCKARLPLWSSLVSCGRLAIGQPPCWHGTAAFAGTANPAEVVGRTPWSARDALVPLPGQRYRHLARRERADGGVGRGPGGPPHQTSQT